MRLTTWGNLAAAPTVLHLPPLQQGRKLVTRAASRKLEAAGIWSVPAGVSPRVALPCREAGQRALRLLLADLQLTTKLQALCVHACEALLAQVAASYFVPFCLTSAATAARVRVLCGDAMLRLVRAYNVAVPLFAVFPAQMRQRDAEGELSYHPELVRVAWQHGVPNVALVPFVPGGWNEMTDRLAALYGVMQSAGLGVTGALRGAGAAHQFMCAGCACSADCYDMRLLSRVVSSRVPQSCVIKPMRSAARVQGANAAHASERRQRACACSLDSSAQASGPWKGLPAKLLGMQKRPPWQLSETLNQPQWRLPTSRAAQTWTQRFRTDRRH